MNTQESIGRANNPKMCPSTPPQARTANEAAAICFPDVAEHFTAFLEHKETDLDKFPSIQILGLDHDFWAHTIGPGGSPERPIVFVTSENQFRRYNPGTGVYEPISKANVISRVVDMLDLCAAVFPGGVQASSFLHLKSRQRIAPIAERARELLAVEDDYFQDRQPVQIALTNGVLQLSGPVFHKPHPGRPIRETLPVKYDPEAKCEVFLDSFLRKILEPDDIDLLQRYLSQILEGKNDTQKILVLVGDASGGKSSLMKILGSLIGWHRVGIVREALFRDEFELAHYANKNFLFHPDMPTEFLNRPEASIFKQLVGSDPLWANCDDW